MRLLDLNLLLYALDESSPLHGDARPWLERTLSGPATVALAWSVLIGFVRLSTRATVFTSPLRVEEALPIVDDWLAQPAVTVIHPTERHTAVLRELRGIGIKNVSIADTIGAADPTAVNRLLDAIASSGPALRGSQSPFDGIALHFHDTHHNALANALVGLERGIQEFDSSAAGLGGCPFAPGAAGNVASEDLLYMLDGLGIEVVPIGIAEPVRENVTVVEPDGRVTKLNAPGPRLSAEEVADLIEATVRASADADWVALCGALPPGAPDDLYAQLVEEVRAAGARVAVDTSGPELRRAIEAGPDLVKPNVRELADAAARPVEGLGELVEEGRRLLALLGMPFAKTERAN